MPALWRCAGEHEEMTTYAEDTFIELRPANGPIIKMITGWVELQRATGMTREEYPDGTIHEYETGTPTRWYNGRGEITREDPFEAFVHFVYPKPKKAWKFW
jgi:hypothetical protein